MESAILRIFNENVNTMMSGQVAILCLLDLSVAFDTVDHEIIFRCLKLAYGIKGNVPFWICDYLTDRLQSVYWNGSMPALCSVLCAVSQGSVLNPLLFVLYVADIR